MGKPKQQSVSCPLCGHSVPRSEIDKHQGGSRCQRMQEAVKSKKT